MSDIQEALLRVRDIEPPPGAFERVFDAVEEKKKATSWKWPLVLATSAAAAAAFYLGLRAPEVATVVASSGSTVVEGESIRAGEKLQLPEDSQLTLAISEAEVRLDGPWSGELTEDSLVVSEGSLHVDGQIALRSPSCDVQIEGESEVEVALQHTQVVIIAGSAYTETPTVACSILDLEPAVPEPSPTPARGDVEASGRSVDEGEPPRVARSRRRARRPARTDTLAEQAAAYREALALRGSDDAGAIAKWREMRRRWPRGALRQEVDLQIIDALSRMGRGDAAAREARRFLRRYPRSARRDEIRRLMEAQR